VRNQCTGARAPQINVQPPPGNSAAEREGAPWRPNTRPPPPKQQAVKRRRADSHSSDCSGTPTQQLPSHLPSDLQQEDITPTPARTPAITRPAHQDSGTSKRLHRTATRRPLPTHDDRPSKRPPQPRGFVRPLIDPPLPHPKRHRPVLERAAKRQITPPDNITQKKARLELITLVSQCC
jgi:hypothetical protein